MSYFKVKMQQIRFQTPLGEPTALPRPSSWIYGVLLLREGEEGEREKGKGRRRKRRGKGRGLRHDCSVRGWTPLLFCMFSFVLCTSRFHLVELTIIILSTFCKFGILLSFVQHGKCVKCKCREDLERSFVVLFISVHVELCRVVVVFLALCSWLTR